LSTTPLSTIIRTSSQSFCFGHHFTMAELENGVGYLTEQAIVGYLQRQTGRRPAALYGYGGVNLLA
jgi:hypothetical protein